MKPVHKYIKEYIKDHTYRTVWGSFSRYSEQKMWEDMLGVYFTIGADIIKMESKNPHNLNRRLFKFI